MKICIDIDGVICKLRKNGQEYSNLEPVAGAIEKLKALKGAGHYLILYTARHMKSTNSNVGLVVARQGKATLDWLERFSVPYDEIYFGKPHADVYIDDNAYRFHSWDLVEGDGSTLPQSHEAEDKIAELSSKSKADR